VFCCSDESVDELLLLDGLSGGRALPCESTMLRDVFLGPHNPAKSKREPDKRSLRHLSLTIWTWKVREND
jgi:hypothetical protein